MSLKVPIWNESSMLTNWQKTLDSLTLFNKFSTLIFIGILWCHWKYGKHDLWKKISLKYILLSSTLVCQSLLCPFSFISVTQFCFLRISLFRLHFSLSASSAYIMSLTCYGKIKMKVSYYRDYLLTVDRCFKWSETKRKIEKILSGGSLTQKLMMPSNKWIIG